MFRYNVVYNNEYETTVDKEIENLMNYLYIIKKRIGDTLNIVFETDSGITTVLCPNLYCSPLLKTPSATGLRRPQKGAYNQGTWKTATWFSSGRQRWA